MKQRTTHLLICFFVIVSAIAAFAPIVEALTIYTVPQGGTGWGALQSSNILIGNGTTKIATSSGLTFSTASSRLTATYASSTAISATTICITGDLPCRTTWPTGGSGAGDPFTHVSYLGQTTSATSTLIQLTGSPFALAASSTSLFSNASTTLASLGTTWFTGITGVAANCLHVDTNGKLTGTGSDCGSASGLSSYDAFSHSTQWGQTVSGTTSALYLTGSPISLMASSTVAFDQASTTAASSTRLTVATQWFTGLTSGELAVDANGKVYKGATSTLSTISGQLDVSTQVTNRLPFANLAQVSANSVLGNVTNATANAGSVSTTSLFAGSNGQVLAFTGGTWTGVATTTFTGTAPIALTYAAGQVTGSCTNASGGVTGCLTGADWTTFNAKLGSYDPFPVHTTNFGSSVNATTSVVWFQNGLQASTTSQIAYASTTMVTATTASTTNLIVSSAGGTGTRCLQVGADGTISATGSGCGSASGLASYDAFTHPATGQSATTSLMVLNGNASTSMLTVTGNSFFTGATATSTFNGDVFIGGNAVLPNPYLLISTSSNTIFGRVQGDVIDAQYSWNGQTSINVINGNAGNCASATFFADGNNPSLGGYYGTFSFLNDGWTGVGCSITTGTGSKPETVAIANPTGGIDNVIASTTNNGWADFNWFSGGAAASNQTMKLNNAGSLGLGTTSPYGLLSVNAPAGTAPYFVIGSSSSEVLKVSASATPFLGIGTTTPWGMLSIAPLSSNTVPILALSTSTSAATSTVFVIDQNGKVGIGVKSPLTQLQVIGTASSTNLTISGVSQAQTGTTCLQISALGVVSSTGSACGAGGGGISDPFTHPLGGQSATTSSLFVNGQYFSMSSSSPYAMFVVHATSTTGAGVPTTLLALASSSQGTATSTIFAVMNTGVVWVSDRPALYLDSNNLFLGRDTNSITTPAPSSGGNVFLGPNFGWDAFTSGLNNTCIGRDACASLSSGGSNTLVGQDAGVLGGSLSTGSQNTYIGDSTGGTGSYNSVLGQGAQAGGAGISSVILVGVSAFPTAGNQAVIGAGDSAGNGAINDVYFGNGITPLNNSGNGTTTVTLNASGALGSNKTGSTLVLAGGKGTGTGAGGQIRFSTADAGTSGSTLQTLSTKATFTVPGQFGLATTSPWALLSIAATSSNSSIPLFVISTSTASATSTAFVVDQNGKIGIGVNSPLTQLQVVGGASSTSLTISGVSQAQTGTTCLQISALGVVSSTGSACGAGGAGITDPFTHPGLGYSATTSSMLIGTSTGNIASMILGSSTNPQLVLSDNLGSALWTMRNINGNLYIATSTATATSTPSAFTIFSGGSLYLPEYSPATSTPMTVNWQAGVQQRINYGTSAVTITFSNVAPGGKLTLTTCNPASGTGGAITFANGHYSGGVQPGNTTTANQCDMWFWVGTGATSTSNTAAIAALSGMVSGIQ